MSASLVGSEMCIRDSMASTPLLLVASLKLRVAGTMIESLDLGVRPQPVSYTHLTLPTICSV
eukprot:3584059-Alexandrium_andersonii.AAC.1